MLRRLEHFTSGQDHASVNIYSRLLEGYITSAECIKLELYSLPDPQARPLFHQIVPSAEFKECQLGVRVGPSWSTHWFRVRLSVPKQWAGKQVHFCWQTGCEGLLWSEDGRPLTGFSEGRAEHLLLKKAKGGECITVFVVSLDHVSCRL